MKKRAFWLALLFGSAIATNSRLLVRGRGGPASYYNTTQPATRDTTAILSGTTISEPVSFSVPSPNDRNTSEPERDPRPPPPPPPPPPRPSPPPEDCLDSVVTYTGAVPETVYVTVDGSYEVTVTASNVSTVAPTIWETPRPACHTELVAANTTSRMVGPPAASSSKKPAAETAPMVSFVPPPMSASLSPKPTPGAVLKQTSTVVVTKKTPVTVVQPASITSPLSFGLPKTDTPNSPADEGSSNQQNIGTLTEGGGSGGNGGNGGGQEGGGGNRGPSNNATPTPSPSPSPNLKPERGSSSDGDGGPQRTGSRLPPEESAASGIASIIASVINSPFTIPTAPPQDSPNRTPGFIAVPATSVINGIPVTVGPSSVAIGSQIVALPTSSQQVVVVNSQTFIVRPDEIVGQSTTFQIQNQLSAASTITQAPSVVVTAGVTLTIGSSAAVVSGTTYRIGMGAVSTVITVNGQTIAIGSEGVAFSGSSPTTFAPAMTIAGGYEIVVSGALTVSVDQSVAVISGTTFRIGTGASTTTVNIGGTTLTIGPSGVILPNTTIKPTSVPTVSAFLTTSTSSSSSQIPSSNTSGTRNSGVGVRQANLSYTSSWAVALLPLIFLSF